MPSYDLLGDVAKDFYLDRDIVEREIEELNQNRISSIPKKPSTPLETDLRHLFPDEFGSFKSGYELADAIASQIPNLKERKEFIRTVKGFLESNDSKSSWKDMISYLSSAGQNILSQLA